MIVDELETYVRDLGYEVEPITGADGSVYIVIKDIVIAGGSLAGTHCEVAILRSSENPWVPAAALHVRPHLVPMGHHTTQQSGIGPDWQYWSRRFDRVPTPKNIVAHVLTVLGEV